MNRHYFVTGDGAMRAVRPSVHWKQVFPAGSADTWQMVLAAVQAQDVVWLPVDTPDWKDKLRFLRQQRPLCPVVVLSRVPNDPEGLQAIDAGAQGYGHFWSVPSVLQQMAQVVTNGGLWVGPTLVQRLLKASAALLPHDPEANLSPEMDFSVLSQREREVAYAVAAGQSNKEVAEKLYISERTVKAHLGAVFDKLGVRDRLQLVLRLSGRLPPV